MLLPQIKGGKLKALAVTSMKRDPNLPDVPTAREQGLAGMESGGFQGLVAPADFAAFVKADNEKWAALIKKRNIKLD